MFFSAENGCDELHKLCDQLFNPCDLLWHNNWHLNLKDDDLLKVFSDFYVRYKDFGHLAFSDLLFLKTNFKFPFRDGPPLRLGYICNFFFRLFFGV